MTADAEYRTFLEQQSLPTLRDWALDLAKERKDLGFLWGVVKQLPDTHEANQDWAVLDPIDAVKELIHLVTHFREEAASPEVGELLRFRYIEYLEEHADRRRFDAPQPGRA
jgi:hypothetical protein